MWTKRSSLTRDKLEEEIDHFSDISEEFDGDIKGSNYSSENISLI